MIPVSNKSNCCGCGACAQICPHNCISMTEDSEGFLYPQVNEDICVHCGLCQKACPMGLGDIQKDMPLQAYAGYAKDQKIRRSSSSGGVFSLLAMWVLQQQGVVFGAAFDDDFSVHHIMVDRMDDLYKLQGSKYLQSRIEQTYRQAESCLKAGKFVLFSGTPCQTAGLKCYLGKEYDQLYLVDVICHGAPSPKVWDRYLSWQESTHQQAAQHINFRNKETGWKTYSVVIGFQNQERYTGTNSADPYMQVFLHDICLRPSCHNCVFKGTSRMADLTLGDAWGIQNWMPEMDDDNGTSAVLVHSMRGQQLWNAILSHMNVRECNEDAIIKKQFGLRAFCETASEKKAVL